MNWMTHDLQVNGLRLRTYRAGKGPALLLAHGMTDNAMYWGQTAEDLAQDYAVYAYDVRGHGKSDRAATGYDVQTLASDMAGVIAALAIEDPLLLGHSMGAATVAQFAATHPGIARRIVLEDPPFGALYNKTLMRVVATQWRAALIAQRHMPRRALIDLRRAESPRWDAEQLALWADTKYEASPDTVGFVNAAHGSWQETVAHITCPTLLLTGDTDLGAIVTPATTQQLLALCPHAQHVHITAAGHTIRFDQYPAFIAAVAGFLAGGM